MSDVMKDLQFDQEEIEKVERDFARLQLQPVQRGMVDAMSEIMIGFLPISRIAIKGFTWKVMQNWQTRNKKTMEDLHSMNLDETVEATKEMLEDSKRIYKRLLWNATPEQLVAFEKGYDSLLDISIKMIKERRR